MKIYAPAKVNLALEVVGVQPNGYHELDMIMAPISLYDEVIVEKSDVFSIQCEGMDLPEENTINTMVKAIASRYPIGTYAIQVKKEIPSQAGLAGGSTDAAAVLLAINEMENLQLDMDTMIEIGKEVGADVPFCIVQRLARVKGIGEKIQTIDSDWSFDILLVKPKEGGSTPEVFKKWNEVKPNHFDVDKIQAALEQKDEKAFYACMHNALEAPAFEMLPILKTIQTQMLDVGMERVMMSGSGTTMMGFGSKDVLQNAYAHLKDTYDFVKIVTVGG